MTPLRYSIVVEETGDPNFWGYFSEDLPGYTGCADSMRGAIIAAIEGIDEYVSFIEEGGGAIPPPNPAASITFVGYNPQAPADVPPVTTSR